MEVLETELAIPLRAAGAILQGSPASHPDADLDKANGAIKNIHKNLWSILPYMMAGEKGQKEALQSEREAAAEMAKKAWREEEERLSRRVDIGVQPEKLTVKKVGNG